MITRRRVCCAIVAAGLSALAAAADAQTYPNRPIKLIVPFPPADRPT